MLSEPVPKSAVLWQAPGQSELGTYMTFEAMGENEVILGMSLEKKRLQKVPWGAQGLGNECYQKGVAGGW